MFECKQCGYCCTLRLRPNYFDLHRLIRSGFSRKKFLDEEGYVKLVEGDCYFLERKDGKASCKVYDIRPETCRRYPFFNGAKDCDELKGKIKFK